MDPLSVFASTIAIIQAISGTYEAIKNIKSLPHEFDAVSSSLPIARFNIECAEKVFDDPNVDDSFKEEIKKLLHECNEKATSLKEIFQRVDETFNHEKKKNKLGNLLEIYKAIIIKMSKAHRVETLMKEILEKLHSIGLNKVLRAATQEQVERLETAIKELSEVESSVPDYAFEAGPSNTQHIASGGTGYQNNGGNNTYNNGYFSGATVSGGLTINGVKGANGTE
ncbi:WD domain-containing protein [Penicillium herquei]|nr:WD domain-containing protein [Penicillium herquei]